jgi:glycosyltransferase involved in cell wall biosynthesis
MPLISICIPTYNRLDFISDALESCLNQTYDKREIIVVDDGSNDGTGDFLRSKYGDKIRYVYQENKGSSNARNHGIGLSRGQYIVFLDSDDMLFHKALENLYGAIVRTKYPAAFGYSRYSNGGLLNSFRKIKKVPEGDLFNTYQKYAILNNCNYMIDRDILSELGGYDETLTNHEDYELFLRLTSQIKFAFCGSDVARIRRVEGSARGNNKKIISQGVRAVDRLFEKIKVGRLSYIKDELYSREHLMLARAFYYERMYAEFRENFTNALKFDKYAILNIRFLKRFVLSYFFQMLDDIADGDKAMSC